MIASRVVVGVAISVAVFSWACGGSSPNDLGSSGNNGSSAIGADGGALTDGGTGGGDSSSGGGSSAAPITCAAFASALCDRLYACGLVVTSVTPTADCQANQEARCNGYSTAAGSHLDGSALATCAQTFPAGDCEEVGLWLLDDWNDEAPYTDIGPPTCVPPGDRPNGSSCALGPQCASGVCSLAGSFPEVGCGTCIANPCGAAWCGTGGQCSDGQCIKVTPAVPPGKTGASCVTTNENADCADGYWCNGDTNTCAPYNYGNLDDACGNYGEACLPGLNCKYDDMCESNAAEGTLGSDCLRDDQIPGGVCMNNVAQTLADAAASCK